MSTDDHDLVVGDRSDREAAPSVDGAGLESLPGDQESQGPGPVLARRLDRDMKRPDRNELIDRLTPRSGAGEIHDMNDDRAPLAIDMAVNEPGSLHDQGDILPGRPSDDVRDQSA